jgi:hypothetical protein
MAYGISATEQSEETLHRFDSEGLIVSPRAPNKARKINLLRTFKARF